MQHRIIYALSGTALFVALAAGTLHGGVRLEYTAGKPMDEVEFDGMRRAVTAGLEIISGNDRMARGFGEMLKPTALLDVVDDAQLQAGIRIKGSGTHVAF